MTGFDCAQAQYLDVVLANQNLLSPLSCTDPLLYHVSRPFLTAALNITPGVLCETPPAVSHPLPGICRG